MPTTNNRLQFAVIDRRASRPRLPYPHVILRINDWDDYHYKTLFDVSLRSGPSDELALGGVKILRRGQKDGRPNLDPSFVRLGTEFCSLGQDIEYYEKLVQLPTALRQNYLRALRDAAADEKIEQDFRTEPGWDRSLTRFGEATHALQAGRQLMQGRGTQPKGDELSFLFDWWREGSLTQIPFRFDASTELPGRCQVLIGYNGVGKTTLLAELALTASNEWETRSAASEHRSFIRGNNATFGAVVAVSYSAFDTFVTPESISGGAAADSEWETNGSSTAKFGYVYCGLRRRTPNEAREPKKSTNSYELKSTDEIESEFLTALDTATDRDRNGHLAAALEALAREPSFGQIGIDPRRLGSRLDTAEAMEMFKELSTGHKIVLNIVAQLAAHLRTRSLVLIDELETHLHPPLVAALLGAIKELLEAHRSFAVIATHSPVVVQETPAQSVTILERTDAGVTVRKPEIETFAENIGAITRHVFSLDSSATDYQGILAHLAKRHSVEWISEMFSPGLSIQGRALVVNYRNLP